MRTRILASLSATLCALFSFCSIALATVDVPPPPMDSLPPPPAGDVPPPIVTTSGENTPVTAKVEEVIAKVEAEMNKAGSVEEIKITDEQAANICREELKDHLAKCKGAQDCEAASWKEFRICAAGTVRMTKVEAQKALMNKATSIGNEAQSPEQCLPITQLIKQCEDDKACQNRLWQIYQKCTDDLSADGAKVKKINLSATDKKMVAEENKRLGAEDSKAGSELVKQLAQAAQANASLQAKEIEAEKQRLAAKAKEIEDRKKAIEQAALLQKNIPAPEPTVLTAVLDSANPFSDDKEFNECQKEFITEVKACQKTYSLNPLPRFDITYVTCVKTAFEKIKECYGKKSLGNVQLPSSTAILTEFGKPIRTTNECDQVIVGDIGTKCGKNWNCRNEAQSKSWMCKGVVSLAEGQ